MDKHEVYTIENAAEAMRQYAKQLQDYVDDQYWKEAFERQKADIETRVKEAKEQALNRYNKMIDAIDMYKERAQRWLERKREAKLEAFKRQHSVTIGNINHYAVR